MYPSREVGVDGMTLRSTEHNSLAPLDPAPSDPAYAVFPPPPNAYPMLLARLYRAPLPAARM
eukprot:1162024-Pelagomonas_calceolata.AAC.7